MERPTATVTFNYQLSALTPQTEDDDNALGGLRMRIAQVAASDGRWGTLRYVERSVRSRSEEQPAVRPEPFLERWFDETYPGHDWSDRGRSSILSRLLLLVVRLLLGIRLLLLHVTH